MAKQLKYAISQYQVANAPEGRLNAWYYDDVAQEDGNIIIKREDMTGGDANTFDNFKTMCEKFITGGVNINQIVVQYDVDGLPERMIVQTEEGQEIIDRVDMGSPDKQIFDNFKLKVENVILN